MSILRHRIYHELPKLPRVISLKSSEITGSERINPAIIIRFQNELKNFMFVIFFLNNKILLFWNTIRSTGIGFLKGWDSMKFSLLNLNIDRLCISMTSHWERIYIKMGIVFYVIPPFAVFMFDSQTNYIRNLQIVLTDWRYI